MELTTLNPKDLAYANRELSNKEISVLISNNQFKEDFLQNDYFTDLRTITFINEENKKNRFEGFNDLGMIYYFIHRQKHVNKNKKLSDTTKKDYMRDIFQFYNNWLQYLEVSPIKVPYIYKTGNSLQYVEPRHIEIYQTEWLANKANYKPATIARKSVVLRSLFHWLYKVNYISTPLHESFISSEISEEDKPDRDLTYNEVKMILDYWEERKHPINYPLLLLLATSGMRVQEVAKAKWGELFFDHSSNNYFLSSFGKNNKHRDVVIFPYVLEALQMLRKRRRLPVELNPSDDTPLIPTIRKKHYDFTYLSRYVTEIIKETNLPFLEHKQGDISSHWLRHFFANHSLDNGANLEYIRQTLGHSMLKTTQGYLRKNIERKNNAALTWNQHKF
ncbi:tyrosine-type recombinase/integrase [Niallia taxi]|uniref:tyrosine-type recombinase/integrase n=1 Tax=Niallia taxi TaxID=2499688 RepID=UPI0015F4D279|nr:tyrosine-type recombinase/integrase [Niallia taxi]